MKLKKKTLKERLLKKAYESGPTRASQHACPFYYFDFVCLNKRYVICLIKFLYQTIQTIHCLHLQIGLLKKIFFQLFFNHKTPTK